MLPRLIHPIPIYLRQKALDATPLFDHNMHEPIGQVHRDLKPIRLLAQVMINDTDSASPTQGPITESSNGYVLFLTRDLNARQLEINRGDRILKIGDGDNGRDVDLYIIKLMWRGHYPRAAGPTLLKAFFEDRQPSRLRNDGKVS